MESNFLLRQIMYRYKDGVHISYTNHGLTQLGLNASFIFTLVKAFEDENEFPEHDLNRFSLNTILDYVHKTHSFYLNRKLPEIEQSISLLSENYAHQHPLLLLLRNFYTKYAAHLQQHILDEDKKLLPYILYLKEAVEKQLDMTYFFMRTKSCSLKKFIVGHLDTEDDLSGIRKVILSYDPPQTNQTPYRILLMQLKAFEKDLRVHALIEDRILIPRAITLEAELAKRFFKLARLN